jgi:acyl-CoA hydrolase
MNEFDYAGLHPHARVTTFMLPKAMRTSFVEGRVDLIPHSYFSAAQTLFAMKCDVAFAHVAPPDAAGFCSLGIASDFTSLAWPRAARRVLVVNPAMPSMPFGPKLRIADADVIIETEMALVTAPLATKSHAEVDTIARMVAGLIPDCAALQTGIGGAPSAIFKHLTGHRNLILRSGMAIDPVRELAEAGALAPTGHKVGIAYGSNGFYRFLADSGLCAFATTLETHDPAIVGGIERFHAVNSALEVDLFGQVNVEWQSGRLSSGVGGAANFVRGALASSGGRAIIALPATARGGAFSRIVPKLTSPSTGLGRGDAGIIVTEHGIADIRDLGLDRRAEALIGVAAPEFRASLQEAWSTMRSTF